MNDHDPEAADRAVDEAWEAVYVAVLAGEGVAECFADDFVVGLRESDNRVRVRGGDPRHMVCDAIAGDVRTWCTRFKLNTSYSFAYSWYGEALAREMAHECRRRLQHFYNKWKAADSLEYTYSNHDVLDYTPADEWLVACATVEPGSKAECRCIEVDSIAPQIR